MKKLLITLAVVIVLGTGAYAGLTNLRGGQDFFAGAGAPGADGQHAQAL